MDDFPITGIAQFLIPSCFMVAMLVVALNFIWSVSRNLNFLFIYDMPYTNLLFYVSVSKHVSICSSAIMLKLL